MGFRTDPPAGRHARLLARPLAAAAAACLLAGQPSAVAADSPGGGIYTCVDAQGRKLTSDRPIPECTAREQRQLNRDGSVRRVIPPTLTAEERAEREAAERRAMQQRAESADAVRRDRNLMTRYPDEAAHGRAREAALDTVRAAIESSRERQQELMAERKPLLAEAEFYKGRTLPARLKAQIDNNEASLDAQKASAATQQAELGRINKLYDAELARLKRLWAGAAPGSLGLAEEAPLPPAAAPAAAPKPVAAPAASSAAAAAATAPARKASR